MALAFDTSFEPRYGEAVELAPGVRRITADNPGPFTFRGTNSYIVGAKALAVVDPGPDDGNHLSALLDAIGGRPVSHIFVSHTHRDHSALARALKEKTGAIICAQGPHRPARPLRIGEINPLDAAADTGFQPDVTLGEGTVVEGDGWAMKTVLTPGHTANHAVFALEGTGILFSADHVMGWSTSIVAPPDGAMADFMASLEKLLERDDTLYLPGHGGPIETPLAFVRGVRTHRKMRERAILDRLAAGDRNIAAIVGAIYRDTDPLLHGAAALSVLAHLEDLVARGIVVTEGSPAIDGIYARA